ncbi:hypothetical protein ABZ990_09895 [Streptomyces sp. NPDC046203]|uniref:hypothetical protein n=1 Tax=Streptomyces sp. NPDC046203 TaxID=3154602 RepID=UPI00340A5117
MTPGKKRNGYAGRMPTGTSGSRPKGSNQRPGNNAKGDEHPDLHRKPHGPKAS